MAAVLVTVLHRAEIRVSHSAAQTRRTCLSSRRTASLAITGTTGSWPIATDTATMSIGISGSSIQNHANTGISISSTMGANTTFNISNNPVITGSAGNAININQPLPSTGSLQGTIANNVIGTAGVLPVRDLRGGRRNEHDLEWLRKFGNRSHEQRDSRNHVRKRHQHPGARREQFVECHRYG